MTYYKIIINNKIECVANENDFRKFQSAYRFFLVSNKKQAQYIQVDNTLYHDTWMQPILNFNVQYKIAKIVEISKEEYTSLFSALECQEIIEVFDNNEEDISIDYENLQQEKEIKISELSLLCKKSIYNGFDIILSDNNSYHFSLEIIDQLNIAKLYNRALMGETFLPYHADGELCKIFLKEDIFAIYAKMEEVINYHTIYYNSLKNYILSLQNAEEIRSITYGIEIPIEYQSDVLKNLIGK